MLQYQTIYPATLQLLKDLQTLDLLKECRLAGVKDIAAMKVAAIIGRGTKKDFIDLYFLLKQFSLKELLELYLQKYPDGSLFIALKSLSYFEDAEADPMPVMFEDIEWTDVKSFIRETILTL